MVRETGERNADLTYQLRAWSRQNKLGNCFGFDPNLVNGFTLLWLQDINNTNPVITT